MATQHQSDSTQREPTQGKIAGQDGVSAIFDVNSVTPKREAQRRTCQAYILRRLHREWRHRLIRHSRH